MVHFISMGSSSEVTQSSLIKIQSQTQKMQQSNINLGRKGSDDSDNVWSSILSEVRTNASTKMPSGKSIIVLGDNESGKTTLVAKLQGIEAPKKGSGLEYACIEIRDEYRDDSAQLSVWVVDGNPSHSNLLQFALSEKTFRETLVMLTVSMATPWSIIEQLQFWARILHDHVDSLRMPRDSVKELRDKCVLRWLDYVEPGDEMELPTSKTTNSSSNRGSRNLEEEPMLPAHTLSRNTGLDIVVVVTKTDYISTLERDSDYRDENFDFIQYHIRQFCIQYGAALFYTSVKEDKNCDLLYKYLVHRMYDLPFKTPALIVEKDAVFIPAGWDNEKKMAILNENMTSFKPDDYFNDVIHKPVIRKNVSREVEVEVEEEQSFLERQLNVLQQQAINQRNPGLTPSPHPHPGKQPTPRTPNVSPLPGITAKKPGDPTNPSDRVLANFFNSLLSRKTGTSPGSPNKSSGDDTRAEVTEELDSLLSKSKLNTSLNSSDC